VKHHYYGIDKKKSFLESQTKGKSQSSKQWNAKKRISSVWAKRGNGLGLNGGPFGETPEGVPRDKSTKSRTETAGAGSSQTRGGEPMSGPETVVGQVGSFLAFLAQSGVFSSNV